MSELVWGRETDHNLIAYKGDYAFRAFAEGVFTVINTRYGITVHTGGNTKKLMGLDDAKKRAEYASRFFDIPGIVYLSTVLGHTHRAVLQPGGELVDYTILTDTDEEPVAGPFVYGLDDLAVHARSLYKSLGNVDFPLVV